MLMIQENNVLVEDCKQLSVSGVLSSIKDEQKKALENTEIVIDGVPVTFCTSVLISGGKRIWFKCPLCEKRVAVLYKHPVSSDIGCRRCLRLEYRSRRYKKMLENKLITEFT